MITSELCQNCFKDLNKVTAKSNFCCQECFDEWIHRQYITVINTFKVLIGVK